MTDASYEYYHDALEGRFGPVTEEAQPGFWRMKMAGGVWAPVAIWQVANGDTIVQVGKDDQRDQFSDADFVRETWLRCAKYPVGEDAYRHAVRTGQWPGEAPAERGAIGDNLPPDGFDALVAKLKEQAAEAAAWLKGRKIETQADADRCETWANAFLGLKKQAEAEHKAEKQPHLDAGREVDRKYKTPIDLAATCARSLKAAVTPYLLARQEEKRQAAAQSIARGDPAPARTELKAATSGLSGRKVHLRTHHWAVISDWEKAVAFFEQDPEIRALVQRRADKLAEIGAAVPWAEFKQQQHAA